MDENHVQLLLAANIDELVVEAQRYAPRTSERKKIFESVFQRILKPGFLYFPPCPYYLPQKRYRDFCETALQELCWDIICREIDNFNPRKASFRYWINQLFRPRFKEYCEEEASNIQIPSLDKLILKGFEMPTEQDLSSNQLLEYCEEDPDGILRKKHCCQKNCPTANLQILILKRYEGYHWEEIAQEVNCSVINKNTINALSRCYCDSVQKLGILLQEKF